MADYNEPPVLEEKTPDVLVGLMNDCTQLLTNYGWYLLFCGLCLLFCWPQIQAFLDRWYENRERRKYDAKCHKDPDWVRSRNEGLDAARRKMQEELDYKTAQYAAKLAEKEEMKKKERLEKLGGTVGYTLAGSSTDGKNKYKEDYNPLTGDGKGGRYRPQKKSGCSGGGCG